MLEIILKGLFIGFLSSAPMGPVGMLCIQHTLMDGRRNGMAVGLGAVAGDMIIAFIAILVALGMGFANDIIVKHEWILRIFGSLVLIVFGYIVYRKNPSKSLKRLQDGSASSEWKTFVSSTILTISNIATLFLYIALFARFNIIDPQKPFYFDMMTVVFIGVGAFLWWLFITYIVNKLRGKFNPRGLQIFNKIIGVVLVGLGIFGIFSGLF